MVIADFSFQSFNLSVDLSGSLGFIFLLVFFFFFLSIIFLSVCYFFVFLESFVNCHFGFHNLFFLSKLWLSIKPLFNRKFEICIFVLSAV